MRYAFHDVGQRAAGDTVLVSLKGCAANVILLDDDNFARYRAGQGFFYESGFCSHPSVELEIPEDGHWYVVIDTGGQKGRTRSAVQVRKAPREGSASLR